MNNDERQQILQKSAGLIFSLQEFLPHDNYTPYDAQQAQEGLMKIHNEPQNIDISVRRLLVDMRTQGSIIHEQATQLREANERIEDMENACKVKDDENAKVNLALWDKEQKIEELENKLNERYEADELLKKYAELEAYVKDLKEDYTKEKENTQFLFNKIGEDTMVKNWKKKYVNRNQVCLFCGKDRYDTKRDEYGYCPLLRDCFSCKECSKKKVVRNFLTFNGSRKTLGDLMYELHKTGGRYERDDSIRGAINKTLRSYETNFVSTALLDGDFEGRHGTPLNPAKLINVWFEESIKAENPKEIMKLLSYYRDNLDMLGDRHL
jgi:hypothetical protein